MTQEMVKRPIKIEVGQSTMSHQSEIEFYQMGWRHLFCNHDRLWMSQPIRNKVWNKHLRTCCCQSAMIRPQPMNCWRHSCIIGDTALIKWHNDTPFVHHGWHPVDKVRQWHDMLTNNKWPWSMQLDIPVKKMWWRHMPDTRDLNKYTPAVNFRNQVWNNLMLEL